MKEYIKKAFYFFVTGRQLTSGLVSRVTNMDEGNTSVCLFSLSENQSKCSQKKKKKQARSTLVLTNRAFLQLLSY